MPTTDSSGVEQAVQALFQQVLQRVDVAGQPGDRPCRTCTTRGSRPTGVCACRKIRPRRSSSRSWPTRPETAGTPSAGTSSAGRADRVAGDAPDRGSPDRRRARRGCPCRSRRRSAAAPRGPPGSPVTTAAIASEVRAKCGRSNEPSSLRERACRRSPVEYVRSPRSPRRRHRAISSSAATGAIELVTHAPPPPLRPGPRPCWTAAGGTPRWSASSSRCVPIAAIRPSTSSATRSASCTVRRPVRHDQRRHVVQHAAQRALHLGLGVHVQRRQRVVQHQHRRPADAPRGPAPAAVAAHRTATGPARRSGSPDPTAARRRTPPPSPPAAPRAPAPR